MLVLSRKEGQTIELPELQVVVRVIAVQRSRVQVGIEAPQQITVHRGEVVRKMTDQGQSPEMSKESAKEAVSPSKKAARCPDEAEQASHDWNPNGGRGTPNGIPREEASRVLDELTRLEAELSAVAELAEPRSRGIAQRVTADAIQRIEGISRSVRLLIRQPPESQPIADLMKVRTDVLDRLRERTQPLPLECCD
ncbi:MAG: carbon storage regulator [Rubripirellula sp.]|nr:carbon storage regulator [Rubripirellula sp.]